MITTTGSIGGVAHVMLGVARATHVELLGVTHLELLGITQHVLLEVI
jgi:pullulanase/glycogen debranching enzyme